MVSEAEAGNEGVFKMPGGGYAKIKADEYD